MRWWGKNPPESVLGLYDSKSGGEFERKLRASGIAVEDLPSALTDLARVPRLFELVIRLKDRLGEIERVTLHRLFWEYGRQRLVILRLVLESGTSSCFERREEFLKGRKLQLRASVEKLTTKSTAALDENYQRLSSIIDGVFAQLNDWGGSGIQRRFCQILFRLSSG